MLLTFVYILFNIWPLVLIELYHRDVITMFYIFILRDDIIRLLLGHCTFVAPRTPSKSTSIDLLDCYTQIAFRIICDWPFTSYISPKPTIVWLNILTL